MCLWSHLCFSLLNAHLLPRFSSFFSRFIIIQFLLLENHPFYFFLYSSVVHIALRIYCAACPTDLLLEQKIESFPSLSRCQHWLFHNFLSVCYYYFDFAVVAKPSTQHCVCAACVCERESGLLTTKAIPYKLSVSNQKLNAPFVLISFRCATLSFSVTSLFYKTGVRLCSFFSTIHFFCNFFWLHQQ